MAKITIKDNTPVNDSGKLYLCPLSTLTKKFHISPQHTGGFLKRLNVPTAMIGGRKWYNPAALETALEKALSVGGEGFGKHSHPVKSANSSPAQNQAETTVTAKSGGQADQ